MRGNHNLPDEERERIDECLSIRDGQLYVEDCRVGELARRFGTPAYIISEDQLRRNVRRFSQAFGARWPEGPVHILPSIKANFTTALLRILAQEGTGFDTFGPGELHAALSAGAAPGLISVNGSSKDRHLIERAIREGARITLDSAAELGLVRAVAKELGMRASVRFRLRPTYEGLDQPSDFYEGEVSVQDAAFEYKAGIPTEDLRRVGRDAFGAPELDVRGVMVHLGRHSTDLGVWEGMVRSFVGVLAELSRAWGGWEPREIDLGGGFATRRDPTERRTVRGASRAPGQLAPTIEEYAETLTTSLRHALAEQGLHAAGKILEVEPGRGMFADAGIHVATVRGVKAQTEPRAWRWVETDTTEMFLLDGLVERCAWTPVVADRAGDAPVQKADLVGISCGFDVVVRQASIPRVEPGDIVAFLDTGAYQDACANNFNALPRPATVLVHGDEAEVVKRRESIEEVFRRDVVPARLALARPQGAHG